MSTILLVGMTTGAVFAVDLRQSHIEMRNFLLFYSNNLICFKNLKIWLCFLVELKQNEVVVNELKPNKLFIIRKNEDCLEVKEMSDNGDCHLAMFINGKYK